MFHSLVARSVIKTCDRLFMSGGVFISYFHGSLHLMRVKLLNITFLLILMMCLLLVDIAIV